MKRKTILTLLLLFLLLSTLIITYFIILDNPLSIAKIGDIIKYPRKYENSEVKIKGIVLERNSYIAFKYFKIADKTGEIIVVTNRMMPTLFSKVTVKGTVKEGFSIGPRQLLVIVEP